MRAYTALPVCVCLLLSSVARGRELDTDGDGLSDFQEIHKYCTDSNKFSTVGDGVSDGEWQRRREFTYTVRSIIKVMEPVNIDCLNDNYQDVKVLAQRDNYVELDVVHYPLNTVAETIQGNPNWRNTAETQQEYVRPGLTTNWDVTMQHELVAALKADGIDPDKLADKELVERVTRWLLSRSQYSDMFCSHYVEFAGGQPVVRPGLEAKFESDKGDPTWSKQEQFEHELLGRSMFANRSHGTCTSTAVYLTTVLRALGIPTRMVLAVPLVDATDSSQIALVQNNVHHHRVRRTILLGLLGIKGYANHTFNEVLIGDRWHRLNYSTLGQNILDARMFGLVTHVHTFNDLSDARLAATWGQRYALGERNAVFQHSNPYVATKVTDHFGKYARIENSKPQEHQSLTLSRAYWPNSTGAPSVVKEWKTAKRDRKSGYVVVHIEEWFPDEPYTQYRIFLKNASKQFVFRADGQADVRGRFWGTITNPPDVHELVVVIAPEEFAKLKSGVDYSLVPQNRTAASKWLTHRHVTITRLHD